jgi:fumarylpyruvate hydrolase
MAYLFTPADATTVPVDGSDDVFPVNRIFCIGKNYADHVREMGSDPASTPPCIFMKPANCLKVGDGDLPPLICIMKANWLSPWPLVARI